MPAGKVDVEESLSELDRMREINQFLTRLFCSYAVCKLSLIILNCVILHASVPMES